MASIRAFMFHDIRNLCDTKYPKRYSLKSFLTKKQFEFQIDKIRNKYQIISSLDIKKIDIKNDTKDYAILTFDDGLKDHYYVYKYLSKLNLSGTFLVPKNPISDFKVMNTHKIQFILASTDEKIITNEILNLFDDKETIWNEYSQTKWKNNWWSKEMIFVTNFLRRHHDNKINNYQLTEYLFSKYVTKDQVSFSQDLYLNLDNVEEMSNKNMVIGGHGDISENLLLIKDFKKEINESKKFISKFSDRLVFSYPNGGFNTEIKNYMNRVNFELSFTINPMTITELDEIDFLEFPRYDSPQKIELP